MRYLMWFVVIRSRMDRMMNSMVNNMFGGDPFANTFNMLSPFNSPMNPMSRLMNSNAMFGSPMMSMTPPSSSYYCSSSVMSMSTDMTGRPQIYESSHSTLSGPGGVKQTQSSMRDSPHWYAKDGNRTPHWGQGSCHGKVSQYLYWRGRTQ